MQCFLQPHLGSASGLYGGGGERKVWGPPNLASWRQKWPIGLGRRHRWLSRAGWSLAMKGASNKELLHIISARPSQQPLMVRTFLYTISSDLDLPFTINVISFNPPPFHSCSAHHSPLMQVPHDLLLNLFFISTYRDCALECRCGCAAR